MLSESLYWTVMGLVQIAAFFIGLALFTAVLYTVAWVATTAWAAAAAAWRWAVRRPGRLGPRL